MKNKLFKLSLILIAVCVLLVGVPQLAFALDDEEYGTDYLIYGDANKDKEINMADVICVERMILGLLLANKEADVNQDGSINMGDVVALERQILGIDCIYGDVNNDHKISKDDVDLLQKMILELEPVNKNADVNQNGKVNMQDVTILNWMILS